VRLISGYSRWNVIRTRVESLVMNDVLGGVNIETVADSDSQCGRQGPQLAQPANAGGI